MRVYTAGPMTGIPQFNYPAFIALAEQLRSAGYDVVSPAELDDPDDRDAALASPDGIMLHYTGTTGKTWGDFLARDVKLLSDDGIEAVVVLPGWERSRGARLETFVANAMNGLPVYTFDPYRQVLVGVPYLQLVRAWAGKDDVSFTVPVPTPNTTYYCRTCGETHEWETYEGPYVQLAIQQALDTLRVTL